MKIDCFVVSLSATLIAHMTVCLLASLYIVSLSHSLLLLLLLLLRMVGGMAKRGVLGGTESMGLTMSDGSSMTADRSDLSLEGHTKDLILLELKHLTDELVHLNRGGAEGGGRDMKGG
jgi:hypothetical protein